MMCDFAVPDDDIGLAIKVCGSLAPFAETSHERISMIKIQLIAPMFSSHSTAPQFRLCDSWHPCWCLQVCWIVANTKQKNRVW